MGFEGEPYYPYKPPDFLINDYDFPGDIWSHWFNVAQEDGGLWVRLAERILDDLSAFEPMCYAEAMQVATTGRVRHVCYVESSWIRRLREQPCLLDTHGIARRPTELLRRTPETEALLGVEHFVDARVDTESNAEFLELLGVSDSPVGAEGLLDRLRALSKADDPPIEEVGKWCRRIDLFMNGCSTEDASDVRDVFANEQLIVAADGGWATTSGVFISPDDETIPGVAIVHPSINELALWRRIGVADRPSADLAIEWLSKVPSGETPTGDDIARIKAITARLGPRVWYECACWLNLSGEWVSTDSFEFTLTMQSLVATKHLHERVKRKTADLRNLPVGVSQDIPFSNLPTLASSLESRFKGTPETVGAGERKEWLRCLGEGLARIRVEDEDEQDRIRLLANRLASTHWQVVRKLEIVPYIDGTPAGTPTKPDVAWLDQTLFLVDRPSAKLARAVAQELGRAFGPPDIADAIKLCFDRSGDFVKDYVAENFSLDSEVTETAAGSQAEDGASEEEEVSGEPEIAGESESPAATTAGEEGGNGRTEAPEPDEAGHDAETSGPRGSSKPRQPRIMEKFAVMEGYRPDGKDIFLRSDGSRIVKVAEATFPWERRGPTGDTEEHYWPKDHCLVKKPLQLDTDVWTLITDRPNDHSLILSDPHGLPLRISGTQLQDMQQSGRLTLYPATYRLVMKEGT